MMFLNLIILEFKVGWRKICIVEGWVMDMYVRFIWVFVDVIWEASLWFLIFFFFIFILNFTYLPQWYFRYFSFQESWMSFLFLFWLTSLIYLIGWMENEQNQEVFIYLTNLYEIWNWKDFIYSVNCLLLLF